MGNRQTLQSDYQQMQYYTTVQTQQFGKCDIYSSNKFAGCFIIKIVSPLLHTNKLQLFSKIENHQNIYLLGLYGYRIGKNCHCKTQNIISESVISFWEYLTYSIRDIINYKKKNNQRFHENQLWHMIKAGINGYFTFDKLYLCYQFKPSMLMVNQEGRIRLQWMHLQYKNAHSIFFTKLQNNSVTLNTEQYLAPQQLLAIQLKQFTSKINFEKSNMFSFGMTLLQCATLMDPIFNFYQNFKVFYPRIQEVMRSSYCQIYSQTILRLIGSMLRQDPNLRPSFEQINNQFSNFMKRDYSINIHKPKFPQQYANSQQIASSRSRSLSPRRNI